MIDPRANSTERLAAPAPLPHVSRQALRRVKNPLPAPTTCPYGHDRVDLVSHTEIYGREYGEWPYAYLCRDCGAYVGLHPHTDIPLGTLANEELRRARNLCKPPFETLWKSEKMTRSQAYIALAEHLGLETEQCHFAWFDIDQCRKAKEWAIAQLRGNS
jgi:hypothetical protein